jgi:glycosyltransferase involved in cell wall biosynthesis
LAIALADAGVEVGVWAADQSAVVTPLLSRDSSVQRITGRESEALDRFGHLDILHDNGMWLPHNHRLAVLVEKRGIPRVVSMRGMLEPWAVRHKRFKKNVAWALYQRRDLTRASYHHATGEVEARNLQRLRLNVPIVTIPNGVDVADGASASVSNTDQRPTTAHQRIALFLGRIYPIKGLPMLVQAWARVRPKAWRLCIAGPDEGGHRNEVEKTVAAAGLDGVVSFTGFVSPELKYSIFSDAQLFILPSHSESFGMAVAEALAHGLPVLTTMGTPWSMLRETGCGWWVEPTVDGIAEGLRLATNLSRDELRKMGAKGPALVMTQFSWKHIAHQVLSMYESVLATPVA